MEHEVTEGKFDPVISNPLLEDIDALDDIQIHGLPPDTVAFELFLTLDDVATIVVRTKTKDMQTILLEREGKYYFDTSFVQKVEMRREIKLD